MSAAKTVHEVIASICAIPEEFHRRGDASVVRLLSDSGYAAFRDLIGVSEINQYIESHPHLIGVWADYSNNKRCSSGWYFDDCQSLTGYFSSDARRSHEQQFSKRSLACADFIKHEVDSMLENAANTMPK